MISEIELNPYLVLKNPWNWDEKTIIWATEKIEVDQNDKNSCANIWRERQPSVFETRVTSVSDV